MPSPTTNQGHKKIILKGDDINQHKTEEQWQIDNNTPQHHHGSVDKPQLHPSSVRQAQLAIAEHLSLPRTEQDISFRIKSCRIEDCQSLLEEDPKARIVYYNPLDNNPRYVCGRRIENDNLLIVNNSANDYCHQEALATLFPVLPTLVNHQQNSSLLPPIQIGIRGVRLSRSTKFYTFRACDVPCQFIKNDLNAKSIARTIVGTDWEISTSMEGPEYYKNLQLQQQHKRGVRHFFATTDLDSDIPMPYFSWDEYAPEGKAIVPGNDYDQAIKGAVFMAKNCESKNGREALVKGLIDLSNNSSSLVRVDSISRCLHNHDPPASAKDDKNEILNQYMFYLAFENQNAKDYITEKLWGSLFRSGTIPVYVGAPNIAEHVPPQSIINVREFGNLKEVWNHLVRVAQNRTLYESYHAWVSEWFGCFERNCGDMLF